MSPERKEKIPITEAVAHLLDECRMVLPGLQALFGFQLIAVFNTGFGEKLTPTEQKLHLLALGLVAIASGLVIAPASYHRQTGPQADTESFLHLASRLLLWSMIPLMLGIGLDFYLIARIILNSNLLSLLLAFILVSLFSILWFLLPRMTSLQKWIIGAP